MQTIRTSSDLLAYPDVALVFGVWSAWLVYRFRRGLLLTLLAMLPLGLFMVLVSTYSVTARNFLTVAVPCLFMFAMVDYRFDSRRHHIARVTQKMIAESAIFVILLCSILPAVLAYLRGVDARLFLLAIGLGIASALLAAQARGLAGQRTGYGRSEDPFQFRLSALLLSVTLTALMLVAQAPTGLVIAFAGAGTYWSGFSLLPAARSYRWSGNEYAIDRQRSAAASAILLGVALMVFGVTIVALAKVPR
jgi:hypothetical protein